MTPSSTFVVAIAGRIVLFNKYAERKNRPAHESTSNEQSKGFGEGDNAGADETPAVDAMRGDTTLAGAAAKVGKETEAKPGGSTSRANTGSSSPCETSPSMSADVKPRASTS